MVYVGERSGTDYYLNKVDVDDPSTKTSRSIGGNVAVISAGNSKIGIIQAVEHGYEAFAGAYTKIYDATSLDLLKTFPLAPPAANGRMVEPLHHRDPSLAVSDTYTVVLTEDDGFFASGGAQQYISVYDIAGDKTRSHTNAFASGANGSRGEANPAVGVGTLMGAVVHGDYIIVGGSNGTGVFKINASGDTLSIEKEQGYEADTVGTHWFKDNGAYVLEPKANTGNVQAWKWNETTGKPEVLGTIEVQESGSVQALCFDPDDPKIAYFYQKGDNGGKVYRVDLSDPSLTKETLFSFPKVVIQVSGRGGSAYYECALTGGLWTIEKQQAGNDVYYVFSGSYSYTPSVSAAVTVGSVLTVKNPENGGTVGGSYTSASVATLDTKVSEERFTAPYGTAVRTLKTFKSSSGDIYFAAKNYTASGSASNYKLVLKQIN
jgi:hypothetical protein